MMRKLIEKCAAIIHHPFDAVGMEFAHVGNFAINADRQKLAGLVLVILAFDCICYCFHDNTILAQSCNFVNIC